MAMRPRIGPRNSAVRFGRGRSLQGENLDMPGGSPCLRVVLFSGLGAALLPTLAWAVPLDRLVYVRPVAVCDNAGNNCTDVTQLQNLATQAAKDIWRQSGYDVVFLPARTGARRSGIATC